MWVDVFLSPQWIRGKFIQHFNTLKWPPFREAPQQKSSIHFNTWRWRNQQYLVGGWTNPIEQICSSNWIVSLGDLVKIKIFQTTWAPNLDMEFVVFHQDLVENKQNSLPVLLPAFLPPFDRGHKINQTQTIRLLFTGNPSNLPLLSLLLYQVWFPQKNG